MDPIQKKTLAVICHGRKKVKSKLRRGKVEFHFEPFYFGTVFVFE